MIDTYTETIIGVHEMHGRMQLHVFCWPMTPLFIGLPMITHAPPLASYLLIKTLVASQQLTVDVTILSKQSS